MFSSNKKYMREHCQRFYRKIKVRRATCTCNLQTELENTQKRAHAANPAVHISLQSFLRIVLTLRGGPVMVYKGYRSSTSPCGSQTW
jgi:hypothetical protein